MIKKCNEFIKQSSNVNISNLPDIVFYKEYIRKSIDSRKPIIKHLKELSNRYVEECQKSSVMYNELNELRYENNHLKSENESLKSENDSLSEINRRLNKEKDEIINNYNHLSARICKIENSRSYKLYRKIKKVWK